MRVVKCITSSELQVIPFRKSVFLGPIERAREVGAYRAEKYEGWSHIYGEADAKGARLLIEVIDRDGDRTVVLGRQ